MKHLQLLYPFTDRVSLSVDGRTFLWQFSWGKWMEMVIDHWNYRCFPMCSLNFKTHPDGKLHGSSHKMVALLGPSAHLDGMSEGAAE